MKEQKKLFFQKIATLILIFTSYAFNYYWVFNNLYWVGILFVLIGLYLFFKLVKAKIMAEIVFWSFCLATVTIFIIKAIYFWFGIHIRTC